MYVNKTIYEALPNIYLFVAVFLIFALPSAKISIFLFFMISLLIRYNRKAFRRKQHPRKTKWLR